MAIWYTVGTVIVPGLLIPVVAGYFEKVRPSPHWAFAIMAGGFAASLFSLVYGYINALDGRPQYFLGLEPMYPGLMLSVAVWVVGWLWRRRKEREIVNREL